MKLRFDKRNEAPMVNAVDEFIKPSLIDISANIKEHENQVKKNHVANQEPRDALTKNDIDMERHGKK